MLTEQKSLVLSLTGKQCVSEGFYFEKNVNYTLKRAAPLSGRAIRFLIVYFSNTNYIRKNSGIYQYCVIICDDIFGRSV